MQPKIIDADTGQELWTGADCADHIGVSYAAWRNYSANGIDIIDPKLNIGLAPFFAHNSQRLGNRKIVIRAING